ncbi:MAG: tRNA pseudouridine(55) synthase TruB [Candidatus Omnitrophica bacterium]|nr:tRNA pseudouridine(55) synthase TruB [Candidatus Omnitrophota bacterium]
MDGLLLFNKPIGWTSHDAVDFIRRRIGQKKVGHAGSLDPLATGLLLMLLGRGTKRSQEFMASDKEYAGTMTLGLATDTQDMEGRVLFEGDASRIEEGQIEKIMKRFCGEQLQVPPLFSAMRCQGKKLYEWSRRGVFVEPAPKKIIVRQFHLFHFFPPEVHFSVACSKGTYVRALCDQFGRELGCGATLSSLVRTKVGRFSLADALCEGEIGRLSLKEIEKRLVSA